MRVKVSITDFQFCSLNKVFYIKNEKGIEKKKFLNGSIVYANVKTNVFTKPYR